MNSPRQNSFTASDGTVIAYAVYDAPKNGTKSLPAVVLLHGLGGSLNSLELLATELHTYGYQVVAPDLRGHGLSERKTFAADYTFERLATDVVELCRHENLQNYVVMGHCYGGMIAQELVFEENSELQGLVLLSTARELFLFARILKIMHLEKLLIYVPTILPLVHKKNRLDYRKFIGTGDYHWPRIFKDLLHTSLKTYGFSMYTSLFAPRRMIENNTTPCLIIAGGRDKLFPKSLVKKLTSVFPNHQYTEIPDANHVSPLSHWQLLGKKIDTFITAHHMKA